MTVFTINLIKQFVPWQSSSQKVKGSWQAIVRQIKYGLEQYRIHRIARNNLRVSSRFQGIDKKRC